MDTVKSLLVEIGAENADLKRKLEESKRKLKEFGDKASDANNAAARATSYFKDQLRDLGGMISGAFAIGAIVNFATEAINAYDQQLKAENRLKFALGNRLDVQQDLLAQAEELRAATGIDDGAIINAQTFSIAQGRNADETKRLTAAAIDMAAALGISVEDAAMQLNATYEGNVRGLSRLDARIKDLTKTQLANGEAVNLIADKYKGFGEASATAMDKAKSSWDEFKESTAKFTVETWDRSFVGRLVNDFFQAGDPQVEKAGKNLAKKIMKGLDGKSTAEQIQYVSKAIQDLNTKSQSLTSDMFRDDEQYLGVVKSGGVAMTELTKLQSSLRSQLADETAKAKQAADAWETRNQAVSDAAAANVKPAEVPKIDAEDANWFQERMDTTPPTLSEWWNNEGESYQNHLDNMADMTSQWLKDEQDARDKAAKDLADKEEQNQKDQADAEKEANQKREEARLEVANAFLSASQMEIKTLEDFANVLRSTVKQEIAAYLAKAIAKAIESQAGLGPVGLITGAAAGAGFAALFDTLIPSFAEGGDVYGPQLAWVGDNPGRHEKIIPSEQFGQLGGGMNGSLALDLNATISGRDLLITTRRAQRAYHIKTGR